MGLIQNDEVRARADELIASPVGLDVVDGYDRERMHVKDRLVRAAFPLQAMDGAGQDKLRVDVELLGQFPLPLLGQVRRAQNTEGLTLTSIQKLAGDQCSLNGLADANVVGNQNPHRVKLERHQKRDKLVRARLNGNPPERSEGSSAGPEAEPQGIAEEAGRAVIAGVGWVGKVETGRLDCLQGGRDAGDFILCAAQRTQQQ
jgi:hypothetical protein